ncbi:hypothetical protein GE21DRAFT_1045820 [Neurospora crassa]|nr:hypothetical protein GE21DRAFT_1045820 [Neurospora crassa]
MLQVSFVLFAHFAFFLVLRHLDEETDSDKSRKATKAAGKLFLRKPFIVGIRDGRRAKDGRRRAATYQLGGKFDVGVHIHPKTQTKSKDTSPTTTTTLRSIWWWWWWSVAMSGGTDRGESTGWLSDAGGRRQACEEG